MVLFDFCWWTFFQKKRKKKGGAKAGRNKVFFSLLSLKKKIGRSRPLSRDENALFSWCHPCSVLLSPKEHPFCSCCGELPRPSPGPLVTPSSPIPFRKTLPAGEVSLCPGETGYSCAVMAVSFHLIPNSAKSQRPFSPLGRKRDGSRAGRRSHAILCVRGRFIGRITKGQT